MNLLEGVIIAVLGLYVVDAVADCKEDNWDYFKISKALQQGLSKETLLQHLGPGTGMDRQRVDRIKVLIDDAYKAGPDQAQIWFKGHYRACGKDLDA